MKELQRELSTYRKKVNRASMQLTRLMVGHREAQYDKAAEPHASHTPATIA